MKLNEALSTLTNIELDDRAVGAVSPTMLDAEKVSEEKEKAVAKAMEEAPVGHVEPADVEADKPVRNISDSFKKMHLCESLDEDEATSTIMEIRSILMRALNDASKVLERKVKEMLKYAAMTPEEEFNTRKEAIRQFRDLHQFDYLNLGDDIYAILKDVSDRANADDDTLVESKKKSEKDLWTKVYDELDANIDPQDTERELKAKRGERYQNVFPGIDENSIEVRTSTEEELDFAKRVAEHYGVVGDVVYLPTGKRYNYVYIIHIPEEGIDSTFID